MDIEALEKAELRSKAVRVGVLATLAVLVSLVFAYWMGAFGIGPSRTLYLDYDFAGGVDAGSNVRLAGVKVGRVSSLDFGGEAAVRLRLDLKPSAFAQITKDSKFFINLAGLIGERYVEIVPGTGTKVSNRDVLRGVDPPRIDQLISQGYGIFGDLRALFQEHKGDIQQIILSLNDLAKNLSSLMSQMSGPQRKSFTLLLQNLAEGSTDLKELLGKLNAAAQVASQTGARDTWKALQDLVAKGNAITRQDLQRLMLEDGVKVNFTGRNFPKEALPVEGTQK
jgi:phospholipid/cholesterol/gamma-HCH transport system substrate-binding protein